MKSENSDIKIKEGFVGQRMIVIPPNVMELAHSNTLIDSFLVTAAGYYPHACHHDRRRDSGAEQYIFIYCLNGSGMITVQQKSYEITPNTYFIIPKKEPHHYKSSDNAPWSIYWFHFTGKQSDYLYNRYITEKDSIVKKVPYEESTKEVFEKCLSLLESGFE